MNVQEIRKDFPILQRRIHGKRLVYLDSTATTQKPVQVIDAIKCYYENNNANAHRGSYQLSLESSDLYEDAHETMAKFINARGREEIIFTRNTTESLNLLAFSLGRETLKKDDLVLTTLMEHHSNIVPWQQVRDYQKTKLAFVNVTREGRLDVEDLKAKLRLKPKVFTFTGASNVLGTINNVKELVRMGKEAGALTIMDAAQLAPHVKLDVRDSKPDFAAFSGHKMLGPTGIGVLYGRKELLEEMPPFLTGGDMISEVTREQSTWNTLPWKFEAGTQNVAGAYGLRIAVKYLEKVGLEAIAKHDRRLLKEATSELESMKGVTLHGPSVEEKLGIISFNVGNVHAHDVATVLDREGIAIRSGDHCAQPLMKELGMTGTARASFYLYNDSDDVQALIEGVKEVKRVFRVQEEKAKKVKVKS